VIPTDAIGDPVLNETYAALKSINDRLNNNDESAKKLLEHMFQTSDEAVQQMLYESSYFGLNSLVKSLLEKNVNLNYVNENATNLWERTSLGTAIINGHKKVADLLRRYGAKEPFIQLDQLTEADAQKMENGHPAIVMIPKGTHIEEIIPTLEKAGMKIPEEDKEGILSRFLPKTDSDRRFIGNFGIEFKSKLPPPE